MSSNGPTPPPGELLHSFQKHVLKVNIDCEGCQKRVKKMLKKIDGVYSIHIDAETQMVTLLGTVDSVTLINKLNKAGKHAELCSSGADSAGEMTPGNSNDVPGMEDFNNNAAPLIRPNAAGFHGSSVGFPGMPLPPPYELNHHQPSIAIVDSQQGSYHNFPSASMNNNSYFGNNGSMSFGAYQQPLMMNHALSSQPTTIVPMACLDYDHDEAAHHQLYHYAGYQ